jgi:hypothetical protein
VFSNPILPKAEAFSFRTFRRASGLPGRGAKDEIVGAVEPRPDPHALQHLLHDTSPVERHLPVAGICFGIAQALVPDVSASATAMSTNQLTWLPTKFAATGNKLMRLLSQLA